MENFRQLITGSAENYGSRIAFTLKEGKGKYRDITYSRFWDEVRSLGQALMARGYGGQRIAIIGKNSYQWVLANAAIQVEGGVSVPLDKELRYDEFLECLVRSEVTAIFYDKKEKENVEKAMASGETKLREAFPLYGVVGDSTRTTVFDLMGMGMASLWNGAKDIDEMEVDGDRVSVLLFTSGTTSKSKIVMLTQHNIVANVESVMRMNIISQDDTNIALLPYHHTFGGTGQWVMLAAGARTVYCDGLKHLQSNFKEYGVSVFVGVPLIVETIYKKIRKTIDQKNMNLGVKAMRIVARGLGKARIDVRRRVFASIQESLGGHMRLVVLGAAAADPECIKAMNDFGVTCIQGYGLTETSPILSAERPDKLRSGSVGQPIPGVEMKIDEPDENGVGEIIARGENIMTGYYGNQEATEDVLVDGWFHTGDLGWMDEDGYFYITGRKKNVIVLRNGKNVFPEELEQEVSQLPYVLENIVLGVPDGGNDRDPVVTLKLVYDEKAFPDKTRDEIYDLIKADVEKINDSTPPYKRIRKIIVTDEPMIKTSTGKVRRFMELQKIVEGEN